MAIEWKYIDPDTQVRYEVRSAGSSLRLYTNDAFHSQYSPKHLFTGAIWDALSLPALFAPAALKFKTALVLGVGGGTVIHQLRQLLELEKISGIEQDPVHIKIAREHFGLTASEVDLIEADAFAWVKASKRRYDVVVDDLFLHVDQGDPVRPFPADEAWLGQLDKSISARGLLIQNHLSLGAAKRFAKLAKQNFSSAIAFRVTGYENVILGLYRKPISKASAQIQALKHIEQISHGAARKLRFECAQLF